jgi:hypothetical protein
MHLFRELVVTPLQFQHYCVAGPVKFFLFCFFLPCTEAEYNFRVQVRQNNSKIVSVKVLGNLPWSQEWLPIMGQTENS